MNSSSLAIASLVAACGLTVPAQAQDRVLRALPEATALVAKAKALRSIQSAHAECTAAAIRSRTPKGYLCQVRVLVEEADAIVISASPGPKANGALRRRAALAAAACSIGSALTDYRPVNAVAGLDRLRFEARALGCRAAGSLYDALLALPPGSPASRALEGDRALPLDWAGRPLKEVVCSCDSEAARLGDAAFVPPDDGLLIATKRALYARGCFLDVKAGGSSLVDLRRGGSGIGPASAPGAADDRAAAVRRYARSHEFQIKHCIERAGDRRPTDSGKLETCLCEIAGKWRLPKSAGGATGVDIAIGDGPHSFRLDVDSDGRVSACRLSSVDRQEPSSQSAPSR
ncbi:MAG: hypothetical protein JXR83_10945 [Deltaproteobacteria bacterium]|nr:hypothetical protein [Deltaproteobacteria bacterium]